MSLLSRMLNAFRGERLIREIDEELSAHIDDAIGQGRDSSEARQAFGSPLRQREASHDARVVAWIDSLRADAVFGWRQLNKRKATSAAAILALGLAIGACTAAFRIVDALFLRPLPSRIQTGFMESRSANPYGTSPTMNSAKCGPNKAKPS